MGKTYTKLLRHQVKKLAKETEKKQKKLGKGGEEEVGEEEEEEEVEKREPKWSDKGATISDKNAIKEFPGRSTTCACFFLGDRKIERGGWKAGEIEGT